MSPGDSTVLFKALPPQSKLALTERRALIEFSKLLSVEVVYGRSFTSLITNDAELQRLNKQFLALDYPTDVLSFPSGILGPDLGDLAISIQRAEAQATSFGHSRLDELRLLMLHGLLHLAGFDHERDRGVMFRAEHLWCRRFDLPRPLIDRGLYVSGGSL